MKTEVSSGRAREEGLRKAGTALSSSFLFSFALFSHFNFSSFFFFFRMHDIYFNLIPPLVGCGGCGCVRGFASCGSGCSVRRGGTRRRWGEIEFSLRNETTHQKRISLSLPLFLTLNSPWSGLSSSPPPPPLTAVLFPYRLLHLEVFFHSFIYITKSIRRFSQKKKKKRNILE